ncbi:MAG: hypothetical protein KA604_02840 [Candidatus Saccharimonas sp.]|nr:hypothetical protein [Candidatus Saccharimonas sp.]
MNIQIHPTVVPDMAAIGFPNPLDWVADGLREARDTLVSSVEGYIAQPFRVSRSTSVQELYQVALLPTSKFAWLVVIFAVVASILTFKAFGRIAYALIVMLLAVAFAPLYVYIGNSLFAVGDDLATAASGIFTSHMPETLESTGNPIVDILTFGFPVLGAFLVFCFFYGADYMAVLALFFLPIAFSVSALGPRTRNVFNFLASLTLTLAVFGRAVSIFIIDLFQGIGSVEPGKSYTVTQNILTGLSFGLAVFVQFVLVAVTYVGIKRVQGAIASTAASIKSQVKTSVHNIARVRVVKPSTPATQRPMPVVFVNPPPPSVVKQATQGAKSVAVSVAVNTTAAAAGVITKSPTVATALHKAGTMAAKRRSGP